MLTVVEHEQQSAITDEPDQRVISRAAWLIGQAQRPRHRNPHDVGMGDRREVDVPHAVGNLIRQLTGHLDRQPGLASATRTGQRDQPVLVDESTHVHHLRTASDEAGELNRKVLRCSGFRYPKPRELVAQIGVAQLNDPLGTRQVTQWVSPELAHPHTIR